ncbi:MAG: tetratricopeptide repeat protein [Planctomycetota bacterium]|jgi:DNA-directed RNA polymerase subunit alpha
MEESAQCEVDLYAEILPSIDKIKQLGNYVHSSESNVISFTEKVEHNLNTRNQSINLANGIGLYILGRTGEAVDKLKKGNDCTEKYLYLAFALRQKSEPERVIECLEKSLEFGGDTLMVNLEKAATYRKINDFERAEKELGNCSNFENVSAEYHYQAGRLKEVKGLYEEAIENYARAFELSNEHREALFHLAYCCDLYGDEESAIDYYKQLVTTSPVHVSALLNLAVLYEDIGENDKASYCIDTVLKYHPNHQRAFLFKKDIESSKTMFYDEDQEKRTTEKNQILETPISDFELSVRSRNCLKKMNLRTVGDLLRITEPELLSYKNFGETSLMEIKKILDSKGLRLGMALEENQLSVDISIKAKGEGSEVLHNPVDDLNLSVRARKCLDRLNLRIIGDLIQKTEAELLGCKNFGVTSLNEIKKAINNFGLKLRSLE